MKKGVLQSVESLDLSMFFAKCKAQNHNELWDRADDKNLPKMIR
jgi:hypothetical protein